MHTSYTVGITTGEYKALQYVMIDQEEWITNALKPVSYTHLRAHETS